MLKFIKIEKKEIYYLSSFEIDSSQPKKIKFYTYSSSAPKLLEKKKFKIERKKKHENNYKSNKYTSYGYWDKKEHNKFIEALYLYDCKWLNIQTYLKFRSYKQIRSHAQKFYLKLKSFKDEELGLDFTSPNVKNLKKIIEIIKEKELNNENCGRLLYIISNKISFGKNVHREIFDEKHNKEDLKIKEEVQLKKGENNNINISDIRNNKDNNNMNKLNPEDLILETIDKKIRNPTPNYLEYDNISSNFFEIDYDNNNTISTDIRNDPIFIRSIFS